MKYKNKYGIDEAIAQAVMADPYELVGDISVTGLLRPPQVAALELQHEGDLTEDVSDGLWRLLGRAVHYIVAQGKPEGAIQECRLVTDVEGWKVSGQFDIYYTTGVLRGVLKDYKVTSVWSYIYGGAMRDWQAQLNCYAYLAEKEGYPVGELRDALILRDWSAKQARENPDFPAIPFVEVPVQRWPLDFTERFLKERVKLHQQARLGVYPPCSDEDRWARPSTWAVQKPKAKRAWRVFNNPGQAEAFQAQAGSDYEVVHRPGRNVRCESYCPVRPWCAQADQLGVPRDGIPSS